MRDQPLEWYLEALQKGDRRGIAKALTLVESTLPAHREQAASLLKALGPPPLTTVRLGLSGVPGVGKSTFIESFGLFLLERGHRVAVITVDPSSHLSGGSVLGDKTRMPQLAAHPQAFIRPSPSGGALGGVAWRSREAMLVLEAAGHDWLLVETVGVGQSETDVVDMTDFFLVLMLAGAGDDLQGMKKGILEVVDALVINKVDEAGRPAALKARAHYEGALGLENDTGAPHGGLPLWKPPVLLASGLTGDGLGEIYDTVRQHQGQALATGGKAAHRQRQNLAWFHRLLREELFLRLQQHPGEALRALEQDVARGGLSAQEAARRALAFLLPE